MGQILGFFLLWVFSSLLVGIGLGQVIGLINDYER